MNNYAVDNKKAEVFKNQKSLILGLAALALVKPVMGVLGIMDFIWSPTLHGKLTALISLIWIIAVITKRVEKPVLTLLYTGITYGGYLIVLGVFFSGQFHIINPFAAAGVLIINAFWGLMVGIIASFVKKIYRG